MNYRDLQQKKVGLIGPEKICKDIEEFFCELIYKKIIYENELTMESVRKLKECDCVIAGYKGEDIEKGIYDTIPLLITLSDLYRMVDELETFYVDKIFPERAICVYGESNKVTRLREKNPNLNIDYYIFADELDDGDSSLPVISIEGLKKIDNPFLIIANDVSDRLKKLFTEMGLEFGRDFHFYNSRVPKHPTSFYLNKTIMDSPKYVLPCDYTTRALSIKAHGNVMACCSSVGLSLGNYLYTNIEYVLKGIQAQLIRLSVSNRTYSFCGDMCFMFREEKYRIDSEADISVNQRVATSLKEIKDFNVQLGYDRSCNLACPSCRDHKIINPEDSKEMVEMMHEEVKRMCVKKPRNIRIGNGELFFSQYYKDIIFNHYESDDIALISNGLLFTPENWNFLEKRYKNISLEVSIDAINPDTYKKLRGGDLHKLHHNMEFASKLRKEERLKRLSISFVIQVENYKEMKGFVEYGKSINADFVHFMKLNSWGHIPLDKFITMDVYDSRNTHHKEFVDIIKDPIFMDKCVHVDNIGNFMRGEQK